MIPTFTMIETDHKMIREYHLVLPYEWMVRSRLDNFDMALIAECEKSNKISDKLLALETIVRKAGL